MIRLVPRGSKNVSLQDTSNQFSSIMAFLPASHLDMASTGNKHSTGVVKSASTLQTKTNVSF